MITVNLIAKKRPPYGGSYAVTDPLTKQRHKANRFDLLLREIVQARKANGLPVGLDFEREVEAWVCAAYPSECEERNPEIPRRPRAQSMGDVLRGTRVMLAHFLAGRPVESTQEASRRAEICAGCRYNVPISSPCNGICAELKDIVKRVIGGATTPHDAALQSCFLCGCELKAAVWTTLEVQCKPLDDAMKKQFASVPDCWKQCP